MFCRYNEWVLVEGAIYQGNPVYYHPRTQDLAWEYCEYLLGLPAPVEAGFRATYRGRLA